MPTESENPQKFPLEKIKIFEGNTIDLQLDRLAGEALDKDQKTKLKNLIGLGLGWHPKKLSRVLNNTDQPDLAQATFIAQILGVSVDALIKHKQEAVEAR